MPEPVEPPDAALSRLSPRRRLLLNLIIMSVAVLFVLLLAEGALRVLAFFDRQNLETLRAHQRTEGRKDLDLIDFVRPSKNDRLVYELVPGRQGRFMGQPIEINSAGCRDIEHPRAKPQGVFRIVGVGDSNVFGWGVPLSDTHGAILVRKLNELVGRERYEYLNFGVPGYNAIMMFETLKTRAAAYDPDLVILGQTVDDFYLPSFVAAKPNPWGLDHSFLWSLVRDTVLTKALGRAKRGARRGLMDVPPAEHGFKHFVPEKVPPRYRNLYGREAAAEAFEETGRWCRKRALPVLQLFVLYYYPSHEKTGTYADIEQYEWLGEQGKRAGFHPVDPAPLAIRMLRTCGLWDRPPVLWVAEADAHPNRIHNMIFARCALRTLVEGNLIPDSEALRPRLPEILKRWDAEIEAELRRRGAEK